MDVSRELMKLERFAPVLDALPGPAYLVGGSVRDLLLDLPDRFDVDLAVVGDGEQFARELAERIGGTAVTHGKFGTATVRYEGGAHVDVATARTETYAAPAALPEVAPAATIEDDLRRRDFTVNAMAVSLPGGELVDPHQGRRDLELRCIRVLHDRSFVDDPTRLFRAARYEVRLAFAVDARTEGLVPAALRYVEELSGARIRDELYAIFDEALAEWALVRLHALGVDEAAGVSFPAHAGLLSRLQELSDLYDLGLSPQRLGLLALDAPVGRLDELKVPRQLVTSVERAHGEAASLRARLEDARTGAAIVEQVEHSGPDTALYALAVDDSPPLREYFEQLRDVRLEVDGDDLAALGLAESPRVGEVLGELRRRKLNGDVRTREAELAAARELIAE